jgi:XisH protein
VLKNRSALGQYIFYRNLIQLTEPEYVLYLAIDRLVHQEFFQRKSIQTIVKQNQVLKPTLYPLRAKHGLRQRVSVW